MNHSQHILTVSILALILAAPVALASGPVQVAFGPSGLDFAPEGGFGTASYELTVSGPGGYYAVETFADVAPLYFDAAGLADGAYNWELKAIPAQALRSDRGAPVESDGALASGAFTVEGGAVADPTVREGVATKDSVINDDLIVDGSACVGIDCVNGESFGFDTLRLKENNLRIKFEDTSASASFPSNDWQLTANDSNNGGANKFSIDDVDGGRTPFTLEAGARSHALYVESDDDVGLGTSNPAVNLHVVDGNTPTLRLEQDGSSGFTAQTWDLAGNEANFFIRDVTNGSRLPFRMKPGAPDDSIFVAATGSVGLGTDSPSQAVHVRRNNAAATLVRVENANAAGQSTGVQLQNSAISSTWSAQVASNGNFQFTESGTGGAEFEIVDGTVTGNSAKFQFGANSGGGFQELMEIEADGDVNSLSGVFGMISDRNAKTDIVPVDPREVLARVSGMPISTWRYKHNSDELHMGPMAQDFWAAFGLHEGPTSVSLNDLSGVALGAIQGLTQELADRDETIRELGARLAKLEALLAE